MEFNQPVIWVKNEVVVVQEDDVHHENEEQGSSHRDPLQPVLISTKQTKTKHKHNDVKSQENLHSIKNRIPGIGSEREQDEEK